MQTIFRYLLPLVLVGWIFLAVCKSEPKQSPRAVTLVASKAKSSKSRSTQNEKQSPSDSEIISHFVPDWVADAVFYQLFPERFSNGDPSNDPTRESLEFPAKVSKDWKVSPWTGDWYARANWEQASSNNFYDGVFNRRYGGDLQGVLNKLDYLKKLGINTIYFNPVFYARSLHKYDGSSMHHIDPYFGPDPAGDLKLIAQETSDRDSWQWTAADKLFLELIKQIHKRDMRLIIDGVFNHTGRSFFAFVDLQNKQAESIYKDWYIVQAFDAPETPTNEFRCKCWWGHKTLPEFAENRLGTNLHDGPKQYVFDITRRWMDPNGDGNPSDGIDGWRLDVANEVPTGFWKEWNTLVRELNPEAYTVGEFWGDAKQQLIEGRFSGTMNYHGFAYLVKGFLIDGKLSSSDFGQQLQLRRQKYPQCMQFSLQNLVDSHDTERLASMIVNARDGNYRKPKRFDYDVGEVVSPRSSQAYLVTAPNAKHRRIQRLVALTQMTSLGAPMVYYGTEAGMWGADDPCDRMPMVWEEFSYDDQTADPFGRPHTVDPVSFDHDLFDFYQRVIQMRHDLPALRRGKVELEDHNDAAQFFAFRRTLDDESVLVVINRGEKDFQWKSNLGKGTRLKQVFHVANDSQILSASSADKPAILTIPSLDAAVFLETPAVE